MTDSERLCRRMEPTPRRWPGESIGNYGRSLGGWWYQAYGTWRAVRIDHNAMAEVRVELKRRGIETEKSYIAALIKCLGARQGLTTRFALIDAPLEVQIKAALEVMVQHDRSRP